MQKSENSCNNNNNNNNNNTQDRIYSYHLWREAICESSLTVLWANLSQCQVAANS